MKGLPPVARAALILIAGIVAGMRVPVPPGGGLFVCVAAAGLGLTVMGGARGVVWAVLGAGFAIGGVALEGDGGCVRDLEDGVPVAVRGAFAAEPLADAAVPFAMEGWGGGGAICREEVRVRLRSVSGASAAGHEVRVSGHWFVTPALGPWPRRTVRKGVLLAQAVEPVAGRGSWSHLLLRARGRVQARVRRLFGERAAMVEALLLARKEGLDAATRDRFARAGLSHVLAISGLHVGVIFGLVLTLASALRRARNQAVLLGAVAAVAYVGFIGAPHSAVRAVLMIVLFAASRLLQRPADPLALLGSAALIISVVDPLAVLDVGFQLSFAGATGIVVLRRPLEAMLPSGIPRWIRSMLVASVAATLTTTPVAAYHFGRVAPIGVLANLLGIPLVTLAVPATSLALIVDACWAPAGAFLAPGAAVILGALDAVATTASAVPGGHAAVTRGAALALGLAALIASLESRRLLRASRSQLVLAATAAAILLTGPGLLVPGRVLELHMLDVGQGDAIAIRSPAGRWILVDAGPRSERYDAGKARVVPFLLRHGARRLEALVLTHPDADHIGGAAAVLDAMRVGAVLDPGQAAGKPMYLELVGQAGASGMTWFAARAGRLLELDDVRIELLHPDDGVLDASESGNDVSVVLRVVYGNFSALLLGDAPAAVEHWLIDRYGAELDVDVVKIGHHGSATSTSTALLQETTPELALVSVGRRNRYGHPDEGVLARLHEASVRVMRTDRHGSVLVRASADGRLEVRGER